MTDYPEPRMPSPPAIPVPAGAWDCHTHVFGPFDRFPLAQASSYAPPIAPAARHLDMLDRVGVAHGVVVQPSAYGFDHAALLDAIAASGGRLCGVGLATAETSNAELVRLALGGVRALRFVTRCDPNGRPYPGSVGIDDLEALAPEMRALGMHAHAWIAIDQLPGIADRLGRLRLPVMFDHMGGIAADTTIDDPAFRCLIESIEAGWAHAKLTLCRAAPPDYEAVRAHHDALVSANPANLVWGSDWPFIRMDENSPDVGVLLDQLAAWVADDATLAQILRDNPARLFGAA